MQVRMYVRMYAFMYIMPTCPDALLFEWAYYVLHTVTALYMPVRPLRFRLAPGL